MKTTAVVHIESALRLTRQTPVVGQRLECLRMLMSAVLTYSSLQAPSQAIVLLVDIGHIPSSSPPLSASAFSATSPGAPSVNSCSSVILMSD